LTPRKKTTRKRVRKNNLSRILAIDPGLRNTGWSICTVTPSGKLRVLSSGVLLHNYSIEDNIALLKEKITTDTYVIIEEPPIIRVNLGSSHAMAQIFGAIYASAILNNPKSVVKVLPRSWQSYILKEHNAKRKTKGRKRLVGDEKELVLSAIANDIITKKDTITNPHVLDCINLTVYYCKKINGSHLHTLKFGESNGTKRKGTKRTPRGKSSN